MSSLDTTQTAIVLACVTDAILSAADPSGGALRRARCSLREGLRLADASGVESDASELMRELIAMLDEMKEIER